MADDVRYLLEEVSVMKERFSKIEAFFGARGTDHRIMDHYSWYIVSEFEVFRPRFQ